ncbi:MAG: LytTR family DNA-binding domain-containing protein [Treponema sp.]|jgi:DNA-binding LytR/AlgR family response regulator|nr:LytTR family DNA-binding domain-containing protein [Treponema sp.]
MLEIAICDDDPAVTAYLSVLLERNAGLLPEPFHIHLFNDGTTFVAALPFDVIFLDIELGDTTGIIVAEEIRKKYAQTVLVFVSAHESYCKELFRFDTTAFLGKPCDEAQVRDLLSRLCKKLFVPRTTFTYRTKNTLCRVAVKDILFFETHTRQVELVTLHSRERFYGKLDAVEATLKCPSFTRTHHSFLVNLDNVERFTNNTLIMSGGFILPIAQRRHKETHRSIMDYYNADNGGKET